MYKMTQWFFRHGLFWRRREKIEITVETKESWEISWLRQSKTEFCSICQTETIFLPPELGAQIANVESSAIESLIVRGKIHIKQTPPEEKLVCLASLKRELEKENKTKFLKE
jgi:hypothetical protein